MGSVSALLPTIITGAYAAIFPLSLVEGPLLAVGCGVAVALGYFNPMLAFGLIALGDLVQDFAYYWLGRYAVTLRPVRRFATRTKLIRATYLPLEYAWRERFYPTLLATKLAYGIYAPLIVAAGMADVPFPRFIIAAFPISFVILGLFFSVGYYLTVIYGYVDLSGGPAPLVMAGIGIFFLGVIFFVVDRARRQLRLAEPTAKSNLIEEPDEEGRAA